MQPRSGRLAAVVAVALVVTAACGGDDDDSGGGVIEEQVVRPGITAIEDEAPEAACGLDVSTLSAALESFALLEGSPAPNEAALVATGYLREESSLLDVVDGRIVAQDPSCEGAVPRPPPGSTPLTAPATDVGDIVTSVEPAAPLTPDEVLATMTDTDITAYGGIECATEIAAISAAGQAFVLREGRNPDSLDDLAGDLDRPITLWTFDPESQALVPAPGSACTDAFRQSADAQQGSACAAERATLETAVEAYVAQDGDPPDSEQALIDAGLLAAPIDAFDLDATATVVPAPDSPCA